MRMRVAAGALIVTLAGGLAGCTPARDLTPASSAASARLFSSDEDAFGAATAAYGSYLKAVDEVTASGGTDLAVVKPLVTSRQFFVEQQGAAAIQKNGFRGVGSTRFENSKLERVSRERGETVVVFYTCWDVSAVRVLDAAGDDVTPASRVNRQTLEITMTTRGGSLPLLLDGDESWSGSSLC